MSSRTTFGRAIAPIGRAHKYSARRVTIDGQAFDSLAEASYWQLLLLRQKAGEIQNLRRQVVFELAPSVMINGRKRPPLRYVADFAWEENGRTVVADVKGAITEAYRIKRHLLKAVHNIDILEIKKQKSENGFAVSYNRKPKRKKSRKQ